jgi:glucuronoarabinoxylan endo-1,4-beta-xylanase
MFYHLFLNRLSFIRRERKIAATQSLNNSRNKNLLLNFLFFSLIQLLFFSQADGQTISISGRISSSRLSVQNASITFIDKADTTRRFSALTDASGNYQIGLPTSVESNANNSPAKFELAQSYPNPFSSSAAIPYQIKKESDVQMTIYDILGRAVKRFNVGQQSIGLHNVLWDGRNDYGQRVTNGVYFYRLRAGGESRVKKMVFNDGGKGIVSLPQMYNSPLSVMRSVMNQSIQGGYYTIRITNTPTTSPIIVPVEFTNVLLQRDTTISFSVNYIPGATINFDSVHQIIRGFGAASPWYLAAMTNSEVETAFGTGDGQIGLAILRLSIDPDSTLWYKYVTSAKKAHDMGGTIFASPWNAPPSLTEVVNGQNRVRHDKYVDYANHLKSYNSFMTVNGAPMYAISVQNEPDYAKDWTGWTPDEMLTFMKENAPTIGTKVMAPESFQFRRNISDPILNDSVACAHLDIVGGHIYGAGLAAYPLAKEKGKEVWMTEHLIGENNSGFNLSWAIQLGKEMNDVMKADMNAYVWWTMVRYYGPIGDGTKAATPQDPNEIYPQKGEVTKKGYVMSQFSKFIRPGYYRVESSVFPSSTMTGVDVTAYKDSLSSKVVIVAINSGSTQIDNIFRIQHGAKTTTLTPYTTSESKNCEQGNGVTITDGSFTYTLEPLSITTFISN